jgi:hypothetical protein
LFSGAEGRVVAGLKERRSARLAKVVLPAASQEGGPFGRRLFVTLIENGTARGVALPKCRSDEDLQAGSCWKVPGIIVWYR